MKFVSPHILAALLAGSAASSFAQDQRGGPPPGGPEGGHRPPPPIIEALDLNHDGIIDASEIAQAAQSLKKLDRNGDSVLTPDELRPPRPPGDQQGQQHQPPPRP